MAFGIPKPPPNLDIAMNFSSASLLNLGDGRD
jgi:hypothetical protein